MLDQNNLLQITLILGEISFLIGGDYYFNNAN